jgi:hypothetical protein
VVTLEIDGWRCSDHGLSRSAVCLASGVGYACSKAHGLWPTVKSYVAMPPAVVAWLVYPVLLGTVPSDDLESAPERVGQK